MLQHFIDAAKALDLDIDLIMYGCSSSVNKNKKRNRKKYEEISFGGNCDTVSVSLI